MIRSDWKKMPLSGRSQALLWWVLISGCFWGPAKASEPVSNIKEIRICSPEWEYYSQKDGKGLYHELWTKIYKDSGIKVEVGYFPFKRCQDIMKKEAGLESRTYDAFAAAYPEKGMLHPKYHLGVDLLSVVYPTGAMTTWAGQGAFKGKTLGWMRGFDFDKQGVITAKPVVVHEYSKLIYGLRMLTKGRLDFVVEYTQEVRDLLKTTEFNGKLSAFYDQINGKKYYMIFPDTEKSRLLINMWDETMARLSKSGALKKMYARFEDRAYE